MQTARNRSGHTLLGHLLPMWYSTLNNPVRKVRGFLLHRREETQKRQATCPKTHSQHRAEPGLVKQGLASWSSKGRRLAAKPELTPKCCSRPPQSMLGPCFRHSSLL